MVQTAPSLGDRAIRVRTGHFRFRTGDRYLGGQVWEHYLAFELQQTWIKAINCP